ncbi:prepilin-type N-terminal cleavage/methylation domain-containing protein [Aliidiomarina indica]|uniref:prepilin-type N-terminal cleavage/methylation domain-containing protein n=1 Tax=Aliidiomarina indica TaxID=2749147 RepID=UPI00188E75B5|nr:prepilin-type N-terminal cleavage/methylation domain-containing protein [Aliidiomarina indica]
MERVTVRFKRGSGFTLVELIVVVVIIGIMGVFAAPRFVGSGAVDEVGATREASSLLRLQQQRAMQNTALSCYGVNLASTSIAPTTCGPANAVAQSVDAASGQIFTLTPATPSLYFNGLGCAVTTPGAECDDVDRQLDFVGGDFRSLCIGGQGYIREGECP